MYKAPFAHVYSARDVRYCADRMGSPMFSPATMRFFNSRLLSVSSYVTTATDSETGAVGYIVTSERYDYDSPRFYSVRRYTIKDGKHPQFDTVSDFQEFMTASQAKSSAQAFAVAERAELAALSAPLSL